MYEILISFVLLSHKSTYVSLFVCSILFHAVLSENM